MTYFLNFSWQTVFPTNSPPYPSTMTTSITMHHILSQSHQDDHCHWFFIVLHPHPNLQWKPLPSFLHCIMLHCFATQFFHDNHPISSVLGCITIHCIALQWVASPSIPATMTIVITFASWCLSYEALNCLDIGEVNFFSFTSKNNFSDINPIQ